MSRAKSDFHSRHLLRMFKSKFGVCRITGRHAKQSLVSGASSKALDRSSAVCSCSCPERPTWAASSTSRDGARLSVIQSCWRPGPRCRPAQWKAAHLTHRAGTPQGVVTKSGTFRHARWVRAKPRQLCRGKCELVAGTRCATPSLIATSWSTNPLIRA